MSKPVGIIAYGKSEDRLKLAAVAKRDGMTGSKVILNYIRARYKELYGDMDPSLAAPAQSGDQ